MPTAALAAPRDLRFAQGSAQTPEGSGSIARRQNLGKDRPPLSAAAFLLPLIQSSLRSPKENDRLAGNKAADRHRSEDLLLLAGALDDFLESAREG